ncbi:MAG TPA: type ISP restriction/modification enzyme, partial [Planctomycetaceae bacterium]|nr:type ISP restriction/modification enzyme [Planctomycetaceae bacterium]
RVSSFEDFQRFCQAGRELAALHIGYETAPMYPATLETSPKTLNPSHYRVEKMRFGKTGGKKDTSKIVYNEHITVTGIPDKAYEYVVNGKSAIEWLMDRQRVREDTRGKSGIVNDPNDWATETMNDPKYPLELLLRIIHVSLETVQIMTELPSFRTGQTDE